MDENMFLRVLFHIAFSEISLYHNTCYKDLLLVKSKIKYTVDFNTIKEGNICTGTAYEKSANK